VSPKLPKKSYCEEIDNFVVNLTNDAKMVYGGITKKSLEERQEEHIQKSKKFDGMRIIEIFTIELKSTNARDNNQVKYSENHLIKKLNEKFGKKCINDRNDDGSIAQRGGTGIDGQVGDMYKLYVMYK
jgi:hypothetical protein